MADNMNGDGNPDRDLEALFTEARGQRPHPDLVSRVVADAHDVQAEASARLFAHPRRAYFRTPPAVVSALGGWSGLSGVTAAGLVGLAIGYWSPDAVEQLSGGQLAPVMSAASGWTPELTELALEDGDV